MQFFKRATIIAAKNSRIVGDPFQSYRISVAKVDRGYLTNDEFKAMLSAKEYVL